MSSRSRRRSHSLRTHRLPAIQPRPPRRLAPLRSPRHHPGQDRRAGLQCADLGRGGRGAAAELPGRAGLLVQAGRVLSAGLLTGEASGVGRLKAALHFRRSAKACSTDSPKSAARCSVSVDSVTLPNGAMRSCGTPPCRSEGLSPTQRKHWNSTRRLRQPRPCPPRMSRALPLLSATTRSALLQPRAPRKEPGQPS
jgi:hypothetical protein